MIAGKTFNTNYLTALQQQAAPRVVSAIKTASARTGVDFAYLLEKAAAESSFNARAQSKTSTAAGLFQFIEKTWLTMVKNYGHKYGMGQYADKIDSRGRVSDPALRREILSLRKNPEKASFLAAEFAAENQRYLEQHLGGKADIGSVELYLAHFLGAGSATAFLKEMKANPLATAADMFPQAARANRNVFYDRRTGEARSLSGVYDFFAGKFGEDSAPPVAAAPAPPPAPSSRFAASGSAQDPRRAAMEDLVRRQMAMDNAALEVFMPRPARIISRPGHGFASSRTAAVPSPRPALVVDPAEIMVIARMEPPARSRATSHRLND